MKIIIAGSRDFDDYKVLREYCDHVLQNQTDIEIVSGTAKGADQLGERYATEKGYKIAKFPADWDRYKKAAGYIRNEDMAKYADALIAFWNGNSKGTEHMINLATKYKLKIRVCNYTM
jgi:hypothetical protein